MNAGTAGPLGFERRRSERFALPPRSAAISVVGARLVNVSAHGMLIESMVPMEEDLTLQLRLLISGEKADVEARVARCSMLASGRRRLYGVGLEFTTIPPGVQQRLLAVLAAARTAHAPA
jgi:Tfp pilus assembly protein PilZ